MLTQEQMNKLSPMMRQYLEVKEQHRDQILFFRLGDFYEMFFEDALLVSKELELTLTGRECGLSERAPMCGVPYHSAESYIDRLIKRGYKVAICEQMENPSLAKGLVKREITRVVTPGTLIDSSLLEEGSNNYLCCVCWQKEGCGLAFADVSTGEMNVTQLPGGDSGPVLGELGKFAPREVVFNEGLLDQPKITAFMKEKLSCTADILPEELFSAAAAQLEILRQFKAKNLTSLGLVEMPAAVAALGALLAYLRQTQRVGLERIQEIHLYSDKQFMRLDLTARRNLELTETIRGRERRGTLLWVLDKTRTSMGKRLMRSWIEQPLISAALINKRLNAVEELTRQSILVDRLTGQLTGVYDMERLMTKIVYGNASPRDITALGAAMMRLPGLRELLGDAVSSGLQEIFAAIDPLTDMAELIAAAIDDEPPITLKDGGVIRPGYDPKLDEVRYLSDHMKEIIADIEAREREATGIKGLKVGFNRVFGYYIEVTKSYLSQVPDTYIRKQTLANCERYITQELKELETRVLTAQEEILALESRLFEEVRAALAGELGRIQSTAAAVARLDVLCSLAAVAMSGGYTRPIVDLSDGIIITDGRHPVVEEILSGAPFVPNDTALNGGENQIAIITGPNMAGKSTYMRQVALIVIMAQMGSYVPAQAARIGVVDKIFTRIGASDDLSGGKSTFMVEMNEVAQLLQRATRRSLLILDEIGRGTSTYDGMSIARAVLEWCADAQRLGARTLFATHYHELTVLEGQLSGVKNYNIAAKKKDGEIVFLRKILPGGADQSYGIEVAQLAGLPPAVIARARSILQELERGEGLDSAAAASDPVPASPPPLEPGEEEVLQALRNLSLDALSPIQALNLLFTWKSKV